MATKPHLVKPEVPTVYSTIKEFNALLSTSGRDHPKHAMISPRLAKELILNQPAEYQRRIDHGTVALYARQMAHKPTFWRHQQADNVMMFDTENRMMLGHHRCAAAIKANFIFGAWIVGNLQSSEIKYLDQVRPRTTSQTLDMFGHHNAGVLAGIAKMFFMWTINESPLVSSRIAPDEAEEVLATYPEIQSWYLQAKRIKANHKNSTPSVPWLTYIIGQMHIADEELGREFSDSMESWQDGRKRMKMVTLLHSVWNGRQQRISLAMKVWYHNTAARAWEAYVIGGEREKLKSSPKDRLLPWATPKKPKERKDV